jgi:hypothetical protein
VEEETKPPKHCDDSCALATHVPSKIRGFAAGVQLAPACACVVVACDAVVASVGVTPAVETWVVTEAAVVADVL